MATDSRAERSSTVPVSPEPRTLSASRASRAQAPSRPAVGTSSVVKRQHGAARSSGAGRMAKKDTTDGQPAGGDLVIGEGVQFSGQIRACERLIVSGRVDAEFPGDCLEIRDGGRYRGEARVRSAEIHGTFEGTLRVEGTLSLGATASVSGAIRYDTLEIAAGGELRGDVDRIEPDRTTAQASEQESAAGQGATAGNLTVGV